MAKAKNPMRSCIPLGESSSRQNMVARMKPVTITTPKRTKKISGIRHEFLNVRFDSTAISVHIGFAKAGTIAVGFTASVVAPGTNFPLEMLALIASFSDKSYFAGVVSEFRLVLLLVFCRVLLKSTKAFVPSGEPSSSRIKSRANSVLFSFSGIGCPKSAKNWGKFDGEPL
ncbi:hypothetical protein HAX54_049783 [Datura stramonium]|uniref:Uncharacterized protein n=1 Tax=Datura stramonium TaxID=4076 RepID=A0ABS8SXA6_DATST|nr:hypothetical protein [Datura stramonium]